MTSARSGVDMGRYQIRRRLGVTGMSEVFLAGLRGESGLGMDVVIRQMLPQYLSYPVLVQAFIERARIAKRLHHANVARVYEVDAQAGIPFFSMEYVHGEDLDSLLGHCAHSGTHLGIQPGGIQPGGIQPGGIQPGGIQTGAGLPLEHVLGIAIAAAAGLDHAHDLHDEAGRAAPLVHGALTPAKVMIGHDGAVKLLGFAVARAPAGWVAQGEEVSARLYESPEKHRGEGLSARSDIFSLGAILWEMVGGQEQFLGAKREGAHGHGTSFPADLPLELERIILRATEADAMRRYSTAAEMLLDLEAFARARGMAISSGGLAAYMRAQVAVKLAAGAPPLMASDHALGMFMKKPRLHTMSTTLATGALPPALLRAARGSHADLSALQGSGRDGSEGAELQMHGHLLPTAIGPSNSRPANSRLSRILGLLAGLIVGVVAAGLLALHLGWFDKGGGPLPSLGGTGPGTAPDTAPDTAPGTAPGPEDSLRLRPARATTPVLTPSVEPL